MVDSDISGVLFTANPLTGLRSQMVIDATFGLGEALVSGLIEPDHYVVKGDTGEICEFRIGSKQLATRERLNGGVENITELHQEQSTLSEELIKELVKLGAEVQKEFGTPQDIEWAWTEGKLYLLQSRPITSLFPIPKESVDPLIIWFSFSSVQGISGPITPLGQDGILHVVAGGATMFGVKLKPDQVDVFSPAGERIWVKISDVIRNPIGNRIFDGLLEYVEPSVGQILKMLAVDPHLGAGKGKIKFSTLRRIAHFGFPIMARMMRNLLKPDEARAKFDRTIDDYLASVQIPANDDPFRRLENILAFLRDRVSNVFAFLLPQFIPIFGPSMAGLNILLKFSGDRSLALQVTRGMPNNVTTQMDLELWKTAVAIHDDAESYQLFLEITAAELAQKYLDHSLPVSAQTAVDRFLAKYGARGVGEIDLGQPRWRENPAPVMATLQSYLQVNPEAAPDVLFKQGEQAALAAIEIIAKKVRKEHMGRIKEKIVRAAARRVRLLMGARESPKFFAVRTMGVVHNALMEVGKEFVVMKEIDQPDDLFYLSIGELESLSKENMQPQGIGTISYHWKSLIAIRRAAYQRELVRKQVPRVLVSDGRTFYEGLGAQTDNAIAITGSPVSPGVAEGIVHVILDPRQETLNPGEILVCPGTDPAWTPLFLTAAGLVMEVGGMMTHGSVVAREYGIPAVVGVHQATQRLKNGQRIRLDGTAGKIIFL
jgi:phosphohistidine swiveling domain-containing protein